VLAHGRLERLRSAAIDRGVLADHGVLADLDRRLLALELEILWIAAEHRSDANFHAARKIHVPFEHRARCDDAVIGVCTFLSDDRIRSDLNAVSQLGVRGHDCGRMNVYSRVHLSRTTAPISASHTI